jgi:hypothetical protein
MHETRGALNPGRFLMVRAEPLTLAKQVCRRMVDVIRVADGALLLDADPAWSAVINTVLVMKGVKVGELTTYESTRQDA